MSLAEFTQGERNVLSGDFGEAWLHAAAAGCGHLHGPHATLDLIKADILLTLRGLADEVRNPCVLVQVKTTTDLRDHDDNHWAYDLDVETYQVLRRTNERTRRILAVIALSEDGETIRLMPDGTLLVGQTTWGSLEGAPESPNTSSQVVLLPKSNVLDPDGLRTMLTSFGVPRSSEVPDVDEWGGES
ncbi:DUF4365 domain-containing protein [Nocardioides sp. HM23]|uniref:DUF4365 domain-containing protein n=1 Tax=Nocardioides bizhenqiangii TaxID=3095076 RepID=UPI002ACAFB37|nr:DUF4365 domain-containing protein [Nocardioides sp. HM23]MDZ5623336.1 DUF4365 domain-containing protein [Nocardioides sp. HM23]